MSDEAWLELAGSKRVRIGRGCSMGRGPSNQVVLRDEKVSRRHAIIHAQENGEHWLVDLGSSNGICVNGRRVAGPVALHDGDQIEIGPFRLIFHAGAADRGPEADKTDVGKTLHEVKHSLCWLLLADITSSTLLARKHAPDEWQAITRRWFEPCKQVIDRSGGIIDIGLGRSLL